MPGALTPTVRLLTALHYYTIGAQTLNDVVVYEVIHAISLLALFHAPACQIREAWQCLA